MSECPNCMVPLEEGFCPMCGKMPLARIPMGGQVGLRHAAVEEPPQDVFFGTDPGLALVHAPMSAWLKAHPCECEALCECDSGPKGDAE